MQVQYNDTGAQQTFATDQRYVKRKMTRQRRKVASNFDKCVTLYNKKGWQTNAWRVAVNNAMKDEQIKS